MSDANQPISHPVHQELDEASQRERHDFLATLLKESRSTLIDFMFKQAAVLTAVIGWLAASKETRSFIQAHQFLRIVGIVAICFYFSLLVFWIRGYRQRSNTAYLQLLNLRYMPKEFYASLRVTNLTAASLISAYFTLCVLIIATLVEIG